MLPDHAGGSFETATRGTRLTNRVFTDSKAPLVRRGTLGFWMQQVAWGGSKAIGTSSSYELSGWGATGGVETAVGPLGSVGLSIGYLAGKDGKGIGENELVSSQYEGGAYWRAALGPIRAFARATVGALDFEGSRFFAAPGDTLPSREANGKWKGRIFSASAGLAYDARVGPLSVRPAVGIEYFALNEKGYTETGGGEAFDLTVGSRKSTEMAANATVSLGYDIIRADTIDDAFLRVELEAGRRQILNTELGETTARFGEGAPFTLESEKRTSGWIGGGRVIGGGAGLALTGEVSTEEQQSEMSLGGRLGLQFTF
jgi:outer membrane autotransporter protein